MTDQDQRSPAADPRLTRIVVGVDDSPASHAALNWAVRAAHRGRGQVFAYAVWQAPAQVGGMFPRVVLPDVDLEGEARAWLDRAAAAAPRGDIVPVVTEGDPADVLVDAAGDAALLVLGHSRRSALAETLLGSVGRRCTRHAPCPVVLVPEPDQAR